MTAETRTLEPLFCPPEYASPASFAEVCSPYSAASALHSLVTIGNERFDNAEHVANQCAHRFEVLGERFYSDEQLQAERAEYQELVPVMFHYAWCSTCWWGFPLEMWHSHADDLQQLLTEAQEGDERYRGLTVGELLAALIQVGGDE